MYLLSASKDLTTTDALLTSVIGIAVVFVVLLLIMVVI